jgi:GNAT superfamily N-acetyltransferase
MPIIIPHVDVEDPFEEYPSLKRIWPEPYRMYAEEASKEDCQSGQFFFILRRDEIVGITGLFFLPDNDTDVFLRWHGIVPELRGRGFASEALRQVIQIATGFCGSYKRLVELVPDNEYGNTLVKPFFENCGFRPMEVSSKEETDWPSIPYAFKLHQ